MLISQRSKPLDFICLSAKTYSLQLTIHFNESVFTENDTTNQKSSHWIYMYYNTSFTKLAHFTKVSKNTGQMGN